MWSSKTLADYCRAQHHGVERTVLRVVTDSRAVQPGDLFVALRGERFDGRQYAKQALAAGAAAVLVSEPVEGIGADVTQLVVDDTLRALQTMAHMDRRCFAGPVIAVTGSNGKTTTKELLAAMLRAHYGDEAVLATQGNLNNHIGVPLTLLQRRSQHRAIVVEMGMNHFGELALLSELARPDMAVVTNAGPAHLEGVGSVAGVAQAKGEVFEGLTQQGVAIINGDDYFAPYWEVLNRERKCVRYGLSEQADVCGRYEEGLLQVRLSNGEEVVLRPPFKGRHNASNVLAAMAVGECLDIPLDVMCRGIESAVNVGGRQSQLQLCADVSLIDDSYNANPASMVAAAQVLAEEPGKKILVLGDIGELGAETDRLHADVLSDVTQRGVDHVLTLGDAMKRAGAQVRNPIVRTFDERADLVADLVALSKNKKGEKATILVKGSRFMAMEKVIVDLKAAMKEAC